jgi:plastocyanin
MPNRFFHPTFFLLAISGAMLAGCSGSKPGSSGAATSAQPEIPYFHADAASAGSIDGTIRFAGAIPAPKLIDMSDDPACVEAHHGRAHDASIMVGPNKGLANVFLFVEKGLEGKRFEVPATPVVIDQTGCWFVPRVLGIEVGQVLRVVNSDPVTHNIHPMAMVNREWNHSQGPGDPPIDRRFVKPEIMIPVKCNIHSWMHAYIGVVSNPYFAVSDSTGSFKIPNLPPGTYTIAAWQEKLGMQRQTVAVGPSGAVHLHFVFPAK